MSGLTLEQRVEAIERQLSYPTGHFHAKCSCGAELHLPDGAGTPEEHGWGEIPCEPGMKCVRCCNGFAGAMEQAERDDLLIYGPRAADDFTDWDDDEDWSDDAWADLDWTTQPEKETP